MKSIFNYSEILEMSIDEYQEEEIMNITEGAAQAIIQASIDCYQELSDASKKLFKLLDTKVTETINKLKESINKTKDKAVAKISMNPAVKKAIEFLNKETPDMISDINKYTMGTKYGKVASVSAAIGGWVIPPLTPIIGASEALFTIAEVLNYLLEFKRRWSNSERSAINDFVVRCSKATNELNADSIMAEKSCNNITKFIKYTSKVVSYIMVAAQGAIIHGYKEVYKATDRVAGVVQSNSQNSTTKAGQLINKKSEKLKNVSKDLEHDASKALEYRGKFNKAVISKVDRTAQKIVNRSKIKD